MTDTIQELNEQELQHELDMEQLQDMYDFWITCMRLNDLDITVELVNEGKGKLVLSPTNSAEGANTIDSNRGVSEIVIKSDSEIDREYILVHELSHLIVRQYAMMWDDWMTFFPPVNMSVILQQFENINETAVNHITKALLEVKNTAFQAGYDAAVNEIDEETSPGGTDIDE